MATNDRPSVLFAASECAPFAKAGGLGDVVGALPAALRAHGHDARVVLPRYDSIDVRGMTRHVAPLAVPMGGGEAWCAVYETRLPGTDVPVYLLDNHDFYARGYLYDPKNGFAPDNLARFAFLSRGAIQLAKHLRWTPDVFHVHDWPTALVPLYLNTVESRGPLGRSATVLTLHNVSHAPRFSKNALPNTHLPWSVFTRDGLEDHDGVNPLKGGLFHSTMLTAVSPTYAREIRSSEGGAGLEGVLNFRGGDLVGILNGIDDTAWNPATDKYLAAHFSADDVSGKAACKRALQREMHLGEWPDAPLVGVVSRLAHQKGTDVIANSLDGLLRTGVQIVVLGSGDRRTEDTLRLRSHHGGGVFRAWVGFREDLAHRIEAGCDFFLMPSRFEPCGLNQLYSQRYGTLPIVRATGGLDDTVENYDPRTGTGTGFKMHDLNPSSLVETVRWAADTYRRRRPHIHAMQQRAMRKRLGWDLAAERYADVYRWSLGKRRGG